MAGGAASQVPAYAIVTAGADVEVKLLRTHP